jgi:hypothetical protein
MTYKPQRALRSCRNEVAFSHCAHEIERVKGTARDGTGKSGRTTGEGARGSSTCVAVLRRSLDRSETRGARRPATASGTRRYSYFANGQLVDHGAGHGRKYRRRSQTAARARREVAIGADARAGPRSTRRVDRAEDAFSACALLAAAHISGSALANGRRADSPLRSGTPLAPGGCRLRCGPWGRSVRAA